MQAQVISDPHTTWLVVKLAILFGVIAAPLVVWHVCSLIRDDRWKVILKACLAAHDSCVRDVATELRTSDERIQRDLEVMRFKELVRDDFDRLPTGKTIPSGYTQYWVGTQAGKQWLALH